MKLEQFGKSILSTDVEACGPSILDRTAQFEPTRPIKPEHARGRQWLLAVHQEMDDPQRATLRERWGNSSDNREVWPRVCPANRRRGTPWRRRQMAKTGPQYYCAPNHGRDFAGSGLRRRCDAAGRRFCYGKNGNGDLASPSAIERSHKHQRDSRDLLGRSGA